MKIAFDKVLEVITKNSTDINKGLRKRKNWHIEYINDAALIVRSELLRKKLSAVYYEDNGLEEVPNGLWRKSESELWIKNGKIELNDKITELLFVGEGELEDLILSLGSGNGQNFLSETNTKADDNKKFVTPFIALMLAAIEEFNIPKNNPKKENLSDYFMSKTLPNGAQISRNQADAMATFCRPVESMRGGNKRLFT